jgi:hypothetical protein
MTFLSKKRQSRDTAAKSEVAIANGEEADGQGEGISLS